jgi:hypothetical protein
MTNAFQLVSSAASKVSGRVRASAGRASGDRPRTVAVEHTCTEERAADVDLSNAVACILLTPPAYEPAAGTHYAVDNAQLKTM